MRGMKVLRVRGLIAWREETDLKLPNRGAFVDCAVVVGDCMNFSISRVCVGHEEGGFLALVS
jgi:hypothetical protein